RAARRPAALQGAARDQPVVRARARLAPLTRRARSFRGDRQQQRRQKSRRHHPPGVQPLAREVTDAFGVRAVAVRDERDELAIAARAALDRALEPRGLERLRAGARRAEMTRLRAREIQCQGENHRPRHVELELAAADRDARIHLRALHDLATACAGALGLAREEALEHRRKLLLDIGEREELLVQTLTAVLAVPLEAVELARAAA